MTAPTGTAGLAVKVWKIRHPNGAWCRLCDRSILRLQLVAEVPGRPFAHAACVAKMITDTRRDM